MWKGHYESVFCESNYEKYDVDKIEQSIQRTIYDDNMNVTENEVYSIVKELGNGKAVGLDQVSAEHLKHSCRNIWILLARLFSSMLVHGHMPCDMIQAVVVPIIKNKTKSTSEKGNYRPVTLANVISKVFEKVLLSRLLPFLNTLPNQFGFKPKHGTEQCVFILKECLQSECYGFGIETRCCVFVGILSILTSSTFRMVFVKAESSLLCYITYM